MIEFTNVSKSYKDKLILRDINMTFSSGEFVAIIGSSGCGKTTLLKMINKLLPMDRGDIIIDGKSIREIPDIKLRREIGYVVQEGGLFPHFTVKENLEIVPQLEGLEPEKREQRINELLDMVNLDPKLYSNSYPCQLSGGQRQRVAIARAIATNPKVLLCDEATSALDPNTTKSILELIKQINRDLGITVIVITHEMAVIEAICDRVAIIDHSQIAESGRVSEIFSEPKSKIGRQLILGDAVENVKFDKSRKIRITFDGRSSMEPVLANMILASKVPVNILYASTKDIGGTAYGQMIIQLPEDEADAARALHYLKTVQVPYEEVNGDVI